MSRVARLDVEDAPHDIGVDRVFSAHHPAPDPAVVRAAALTSAMECVFGVAVLAERSALLLLSGVRDDGGSTWPERSTHACSSRSEWLRTTSHAPPEPLLIWMRSPSTSLSHCGLARVFCGLNGNRICVLPRTGTQMDGGGFISAGRSMRGG